MFNSKSLKNLEVEDGILHFKTIEAFEEVAQSFKDQSDEDRLIWESSIGFESFRTLVNRVYEQIHSATTQENFAEILQSNSKLVEIENIEGESFIMPSLKHPLFTRLANIDGLYLIDKKAIKIIGNFLIIADISNLENLKRVSEPEVSALSEKDFLVTNISNPSRKKTTLTSCVQYRDVSGCKNDRCIVTRMGSELLPRYNGNDQLYYVTTAFVNIESWRKSFLCYWYQYATEITRNDVSYTYTIGGNPPSSDTWPDYTTPTDQNGLFRDEIIYTWPVLTMGVKANMEQMHVETTHRGMDGIWCIIDYQE